MIELPFPAKILWPNGRGHHMAKAREVKKHREWAYHATLAACGPFPFDGEEWRRHERIDWSATFYPKPATRRAIDDDNARSSLKSYQDGIAQALGVDDKLFNAPTIRFAQPVPHGRVVIVIHGREPQQEAA